MDSYLIKESFQRRREIKSLPFIHPLVLFLVRYLLTLTIILLVFYISFPFNLSFLVTLHTKLTYFSIVDIIDFFAFPFSFQENSIVLSNHFIVNIIDDCNAFLPFLLLASAIVMIKGKASIKLFWLLFSWLAIMLFNIIRILIILLITDENKSLFFITHDISTYFFMPIFILTLYWYFLKNIDKL